MAEDLEQPKARIHGWKGLLADESRKTRLLVFLLMLLCSSSMTFTQLGFIGVGTAGNYSTYILALLAPIALTALLLGKGWATLEGLLCGAVLYAHAHIQPLDLYELYFVGPFNSFALYTVAGFLLGLGFAIALHNKPTGARRALYIALVCACTALFASLAFLANAVFDLSQSAVLSGEYAELPREVELASRDLNDWSLQMVFDGILMFVLCTLVDRLLQRYQERRHHESVLTILRTQLLSAAFIVFVVVQAIAFVYITQRAEQRAQNTMEGEIDFICTQLDAKNDLVRALSESGDLTILSEDAFEAMVEDVSGDRLIKGYDLNEGTLVVLEAGVITYTNNPAFPANSKVEDLFGKDSKVARELGKTDEMRRIVYNTNSPEEINAGVFTQRLEHGYLCSKSTSNYIVMMLMPSSLVFRERSATMAWSAGLVFIVLAAIYVLAARVLRRVMLDPIVRTNESLAKIAHGDLQECVAESDSVEFAMLSSGINTTVGALRDSISEAERRNERDLATAKTIQESALPRTFPPFPEIEAFDLFATMSAAKEVGGDFYDFFLIDDHTVCFLIADVSGKGIPGALFMMAAKTEIENYLATGMSPAEAIASANKRLCASNDAGMFVTVWAATLDYTTGEITYVNAGHNFPLLRHGVGGEWEWIKKKCGLFLGTFDTAKYRQETFTLQPGDELLLYTDGVNEAFNVDDEEYGNDRLEAFLAAHNDLRARDLVRMLRADVASWAEGAEQSDDVTILALEYGSTPEVTGSITVPATLDRLNEAMALIDGELERRLCPVSVQHKIEMALEELYVNVCRYAYANRGEPGTVQVSYAYSTNPSSMTVELRDQGVPFDPLTLGDPTKPSNVQEMKVGGLGILMVKRSMDDFVYAYEGGSNVVVFKKGW